jgi:alpha-galactosidase
MDANRWWFALAQCTDGTYYYQPNRDNAGYGDDSRMTASSVTAFMLLIPKRGLVVTGKGAKPATVTRAAPGNAARPIKAFILAGQSNMQGHAAISTFDAMADDPKTAPLLKEMRGPNGTPRVCGRTWISSVGCLGDAYTDLTEAKGLLTAGFGAPENKIGPEFTFGITMEKRLGEDVLLIKTSWGGRSLHTDFRPPSAGPFKWRAGELAERAMRGEDTEKLAAEKVAATGVYYREMVAHVRKVLADIPRVVPGFDTARGYELAGFVWFQGFNDYVDGGVYPDQDKPGGYDLYAELLGHFIRDVRAELTAPKMPFVIGVMGIDGMRGDTAAPMRNFREAQRKVAKLEEFKGNVIAVETAPFWDDELERLAERRERSKDPEADFTPEERKRLAGASNGGYHYLGAAKILAPIGRAFAEALIGARGVEEDAVHDRGDPRR